MSIKGFAEHGVDFIDSKGNQSIGNCPFCGKAKHFYVNKDTMLWDCKVCGEHGNFQQFLYKISLWYAKVLRENPNRLKELAFDRGIQEAAFLRHDIGWDPIKERYTLPVQIASDRCCDVRLYKLGNKSRSTDGASTGLFGGQNLIKPATDPVYVCEGEWDAIALSWLLHKNKAPGICVGVPGANTFKKEWLYLFKGRHVQTLYDADNAGEQGERLAKERLFGTAESVGFLHWPPDMPDGFDVRDWIIYGIKANKVEGCWRNLKKLFSSTLRTEKFIPVTQKATDTTADILHTHKPVTNEELIKTYRKWLYLPDENVLDVLFGSIFANRLEGDPIWMFFVAPPGGSKSELLMSLSTCKEIVAMTSLTPHALVSGAVWSDGKDPSLLPQLDKKVLVLKDFTTITSMHFTARDEIFGILRDVYDGKTEKYFGTGVRREYKSKFGILAGVTPVIEAFSTLHASLGERFLKYTLQKDTRETEESKILKAISNINSELTMRKELCAVSERVLARDIPSKLPSFSQDYMPKLVALAQFCAWMRGVVERDRYSQQVLYRPSSEVGTRLAKQLVKLTMGVGIFRGLRALGPNEYFVTKRVALNTCPDRVQTVVRAMWEYKQEGMPAVKSKEISFKSGLPLSTCGRVLEDLVLLRAVERAGDSKTFLWKLSASIEKMITTSEIFKETKPLLVRKRNVR